MGVSQERILIAGSGGREAALARACLASPRTAALFVAPGHPGMPKGAELRSVNPEDGPAMTRLAQAEGITLAIIGPEAPLAAGIADHLRGGGIATLGPGAEAARLEASKAYCKAFLRQYGIPTADAGTFEDVDAALAYCRALAPPLVVKASGLAAGKGVLICPDRSSAEEAVRSMIEGGAFGKSGRTVLIEEFLEGEEVSVHLLLNGHEALALPASQDHKRLGEGDTGPNTGGMGAYAPAPVMTPALWTQVHRDIIEPTRQGLQASGMDYRGILYIGLMVTPSGPRVLEFNVRFGDPETQVLLPLLDGDWVELLGAAARGEPLPGLFPARPGLHAITIVGAAEGYPGAARKGDPLCLPEAGPDAWIDPAGVAQDAQGRLVTSGGRVLAATATAPSLAEARERAYALMHKPLFPGMQYRGDIAHRALTTS